MSKLKAVIVCGNRLKDRRRVFIRSCHPQTQKLELYSVVNSITGKSCSVAFIEWPHIEFYLRL